MNVLPPVLQEMPYEDGSFGLDPVDQFEFKFSRKVLWDNKELSEKAIAYVNDERWDISYDPSNDSILVITRKTDAVLPAGDYTIELIQLFGNGTEAGEDVTSVPLTEILPLLLSLGTPSSTMRPSTLLSSACPRVPHC